jgi:hypothetical protein
MARRMTRNVKEGQPYRSPTTTLPQGQIGVNPPNRRRQATLARRRLSIRWSEAGQSCAVIDVFRDAWSDRCCGLGCLAKAAHAWRKEAAVTCLLTASRSRSDLDKQGKSGEKCLHR